MSWKGIAGFAVAVAALVVAVMALTGQRSSAAPVQLVYACSQQPCANAQELEVFDSNRAPIFSCGEFGGCGVFGDNFSIYGPQKGVSSPVLVWSYTSPAGYGKTSCTPPETWYSPSAIWICRNGRFTEDVKL